MRGPASRPTTFSPACASGQTAVPPAAPSPMTTTSTGFNISGIGLPPRPAGLEKWQRIRRLEIRLRDDVDLLLVPRDDHPRTWEAHELPPGEAHVPTVSRVAEHALHGVRADHLEDRLRVRVEARRAVQVHVGEDGVL